MVKTYTFTSKNSSDFKERLSQIETFFKKARKELEGRNVTMTGEHATYNENNKE